MKKLRGSIAALVAAFMLILSVASVLANSTVTFDESEQIVITEAIVSELALDWASLIAPYLDLQIGCIIPFIDNNVKVGYVVSYFLHGVPHESQQIDTNCRKKKCLVGR